MDATDRSIVVLGACFLDYIGYVERTPNPGETVGSRDFVKGFGGKGANQCVMAGRLGARVQMVSAVGTDGDGTEYLENFRRNGVNAKHVFAIPEENTGLAMIFVADNGQNSIVICPNATRRFTPQLLDEKTSSVPAEGKRGKYSAFLDDCAILVCQNEVPMATSIEAIKEAHARGIYTVLNAAPAPVGEEIAVLEACFPHVSLFCPNETEAQLLSGLPVVDSPVTAIKAVEEFRKKGLRDIVVTLGSQGCVVAQIKPDGTPAEPVHLPAVPGVKPVDTTGAGDCFMGAVAFFLMKGHSLVEACRRANTCAAYSVQRRGTQSSFPFQQDLPKSLFEGPSA